MVGRAQSPPEINRQENGPVNLDRPRKFKQPSFWSLGAAREAGDSGSC
jgi:hypothetical protein